MEWTGFARTFGLFFATAIAELVGCFLPYFGLQEKETSCSCCLQRSVWPFLFGC